MEGGVGGLGLGIGCGVEDSEDEVGVSGGGSVCDFTPSPHMGAAVDLLASSHFACHLNPGMSEVQVSSGVVGGNDGCVRGNMPSLSHVGTGEGPVDGFGGLRVGGERMDKGVSQPGPSIGVMDGTKEGISWVIRVVSVVGGHGEGGGLPVGGVWHTKGKEEGGL